MNKTLTKLLFGAFALAFFSPGAKAQTQIFTNGSENGIAIYWRIPSIVRMNDGTLWAFTDKRYYAATDLGNGGDNPHKIDICGRKSTDNGTSWQNNAVVLQSNLNASGDKEYLYAFGDAATVVDRESGKVLMMTAAGQRGVGSSVAGRPFVNRSLFDATSWTTTNVSSKFYGPNNQYGTHLFVTSGRMIQSTIYKKNKYYRIYAGVCLFSKKASYVVYSDDFGETWNYLGGDKHVPIPDGDECKVEELPDGSILLQARRRAGGTGRYFNVFTFTDVAKGEGTWQASTVTSGASNVDGQTYASQCNAELMLVPAKRSSDGKQTYVLLLSAPASEDRSKVSIYWKELPSAYTNPSNYISGWTKYACSSSFGAYTTMALDKTGNIALLAEGSGIWFQSLSLATITGDKYSYNPSATGTYHTTGEPIFEHGVGGVVMPTLSEGSGLYTGIEKKTITINVPENSTVYYTVDGTEPVVQTSATGKTSAPRRDASSNSTKVYGDAIELGQGATTLKAVAVDANNNRSKTVTASYYVTATASDASNVTSAGKTGTTVSIDYNSCSPLYARANVIDLSIQPFAYLRHKNAHIQMITSNKPGLMSGSQHFEEIHNNMMFLPSTDNNYYLNVYNGKKDGATTQAFSYIAVVAPKGVRFLRYQIELDSNTPDNLTLTRYQYEGTKLQPIDSIVTTNTKTFDRTLDNGTNVLYFWMNANTTQSQLGMIFKSIKLTYAIDQTFEAQLPNADGTAIHTGIIDLGTITSAVDEKNQPYMSFPNSGRLDKQNVNVLYQDGTTPQTVTVDGSQYFSATSNGHYYVEAPAKFRIVGATGNFKRESTVTLLNSTTATTGGQIYFQANDESQNYLKINDDGSAVNTKDKSEATVFTLAYNDASDENHYSLQLSNGKYLTMTANAITTTDSKALWSYDGNGLKFNTSNGYRYIGNNADGAYTWDLRQRGIYCPHVYRTIPAGNFKARVYSADNSSYNECDLSSTNSTSSVEMTDLNNDAVHIEIPQLTDGSAALFNVKLKLIALNPEVATIQAAAKIGETVSGNTSVNSYNYVFNEGNVIKVPVPSSTSTTTSINMVFRNAKNEEETLWYTTGSNVNNPNVKSGYSNVYLVASTADAPLGLNITSPHPNARMDVDQAGTTPINTTNIEELAEKTAGSGVLTDKTVSSGAAGFGAVTTTLSGESKKVYLYSMDKPTNSIMPETGLSTIDHSDFRFYTISVQPEAAETPEFEIVELYNSTLKSAPHKKETKSITGSDGNTVDTKHKYIGVKVKSKGKDAVTTVTGSLNADAIYSELTQFLTTNDYAFRYKDGETTKEEPLRGVLYVDMSGLTSVAITSSGIMKSFFDQTADNCLFFMPQGFAGTNMPNVISKQFDGSYQAFGDVTVYDQQPFFSPYAFTTGTYKVKYEREGTVAGTNVKAKVRKMAAVLPFDIRLDAEGHPYLDGATSPRTDITFSTIYDSGNLAEAVTHTDNGETVELTYGMAAKAVSDKAAANTPYYVSVGSKSDPGFDFRVPGAYFAKTSDIVDKKAQSTNLVSEAKSDDGKTSWKAIGTYCGVAPKIAENRWYFSLDLFWKSSQLKKASDDYTTINVRPFRAYYETNAVTNASQAMVVFDDSEIVTTGIEDVNVAAKNNGKVYDLNGRYVGNSLENLAPGLYIQNGRKVVRQ